MEVTSLNFKQVSPYGSLPNRCSTKERLTDDVKIKLLCNSGSSCTSTSSPNYVMSCKESIIAKNYIAKTSKS